MRGDYVYHRYIPNADGSYRREIVDASAPPAPPPAPTVIPPDADCGAFTPPKPPGADRMEHCLKRLLPKSMDTGDLLILLILLLLLVDGDEDDALSVLLTFAAFLLL